MTLTNPLVEPLSFSRFHSLLLQGIDHHRCIFENGSITSDLPSSRMWTFVTNLPCYLLYLSVQYQDSLAHKPASQFIENAALSCVLLSNVNWCVLPGPSIRFPILNYQTIRYVINQEAVGNSQTVTNQPVEFFNRLRNIYLRSRLAHSVVLNGKHARWPRAKRFSTAKSTFDDSQIPQILFYLIFSDFNFRKIFIRPSDNRGKKNLFSRSSI